jgi:sugar O-acyltransferase (sialic acid O-acetyltransferase NeuD family)
MNIEKNKKIIIVGNGPFAEVAYFYFKNDSEYDVVAFSADKKYIKDDSLFDLPVIPLEDLANNFNPREHYVFVAIGYRKMNLCREEMLRRILSLGYEPASYISSKASYFGKLNLGSHCFILEDNTIQPFVEIGNNVILWSGNHIGHHVKIGDNCFISSHVVIAGNAIIENNCFLGINCNIREAIKIAPFCLIGAGALIMKDTQESEFYSIERTRPRKEKTNEIDF